MKREISYISLALLLFSGACDDAAAPGPAQVNDAGMAWDGASPTPAPDAGETWDTGLNLVTLDASRDSAIDMTVTPQPDAAIMDTGGTHDAPAPADAATTADAALVVLTPDAGLPDAQSPDTLAPPSVENLCQSAASLYCARMERCVPLYLAFAWGDRAACQKDIKTACLDDVHAPDTNANTATLAACIGELPAASCQDFFARKVVSCFPAGIGRANDDTCGTDRQCKSGYCANVSRCGVCAERGGVNAPCDEDTACAPGLFCLTGQTGSKCVLPRDKGATCAPGDQCNLGLHCVQGVCTDQAATPGAACATDLDCNYWNGLFCNPFIHKCQSFVLGNDGDACGVVGSNFVLCKEGNICSATNQGSKCVRLRHEGEACDAGYCVFPFTCNDGLCTTPQSNLCTQE